MAEEFRHVHPRSAARCRGDTGTGHFVETRGRALLRLMPMLTVANACSRWPTPRCSWSAWASVWCSCPSRSNSSTRRTRWPTPVSSPASPRTSRPSSARLRATSPTAPGRRNPWILGGGLAALGARSPAQARRGRPCVYRGIEVPGNPEESAWRPRGRHHPKHQDRVSRTGPRRTRPETGPTLSSHDCALSRRQRRTTWAAALSRSC